MKKADYLGSRALKGAMAVVLAVVCVLLRQRWRKKARLRVEKEVQSRHR